MNNEKIYEKNTSEERSEDFLAITSIRRRRKLFKFLSCLIIFTFTFNQIAFSSDRMYYKYHYSVYKGLLTDRQEADRQNRMSPALLRILQKKHEDLIRMKNMIEEEAMLLIDRNGRRNEDDQADKVLLKKRTGSSGASSGEKRVEYTLTDFSENGDPQQISVYSYKEDGKTLDKIVSYDIRDLEINKWINDELEEISEEGEEKVLAAFQEGDYRDLIDELIIKTIVYYGIQGEEKIDYILSDYRDGKPREVSVYEYPNGTALREVNTYDITSLGIDFSDKEFAAINPLWKEEVENNADLIRKNIYEGAEGEEILVYSLSEYDSSDEPGKLDCYDYAGGEGAIEDVRSYNIRGLDYTAQLDDFRAGDVSCDEHLLSTTYYKGNKGKELIDYVHSVYYLDDDGAYKPSEKAEYVYDSNGRLDKIGTYGIKKGSRILKGCTEFTGLKGHQYVIRSYIYNEDETTLNSVNIYEYELEPNADVPLIGGDGDKYTLDKVTRYVGTNDPHDISAAEVRSETYYDGDEGKEKILNIFEFDTLSGNIVVRNDYNYEDEALRSVEAFRLLDSDIGYDTSQGNRVSLTTYDGEKGQEKIVDSTRYDIAENILSATNYDYNSNGTLSGTETLNGSGEKVSETTYRGPKNHEKRRTTNNFDASGNTLTTVQYAYKLSDALESTVTYNADNIKVSETLYTGIENYEKPFIAYDYDLTGTIIKTTDYAYASNGALTGTESINHDGFKVYETLYTGIENYEKGYLARTFDDAGDTLTETTYSYDGDDGSLGMTLTTDGNGIVLSTMVYEGLEGQERSVLSTSFDLEGNILNKTNYEYDENGALDRVVTEDSEDKTVSETDYEGLKGQERALHVIRYDKAGNILSTTDYNCNESGALAEAISYSYDGIKLSVTIYEGFKDEEKIALANNFDKAGNVLETILYIYDDMTGALNKTETNDTDGNKLSESVYEGRKNREKTLSTVTYALDGSILSSTTYEYDSKGALTKSITKDVDGTLIYETTYDGLSGSEKSSLTTNYRSGGSIESYTHYEYAANGALERSVTKDPDDTITRSETYYAGFQGYEITDFALNYTDAGEVKNSVYYFYNSFSGIVDDEAVYEIVRAQDAFKEDVLYCTKTYEGGDTSGNPEGLNIESAAYYEGTKGREYVSFSQKYEFKPGDDSVREVSSTTIYEYASNGALQKAYTYFGGEEASKDTDGLNPNFMCRYTGAKGEETIDYMEGTTCSYQLDDIRQWDYYIRENFTYDEEGRNTGYIEEIYTPGDEWVWESENSDILTKTLDVKFSKFDEKDRYGKVERSVLEWDEGNGVYNPTGEVTIQDEFQYDDKDNVLSYIETYINPGEDTQYREYIFEDYNTDGKAGIITAWEMDEEYTRTGDYSRKSDIVYDDYGRMVAYTQTGYNDGRKRTSYIFDIIYDKDLVIQEKVRTEGEIIYFGDDHSVRDYKYSSRKELQTTVLTNGDYISITDKDGRTIYFEWTPAMAPYRGNELISDQEAEGAGPRSGSQAASSPVADILMELVKIAAHQEIIPDGQTQVEYTEEGEVSKITDAKGNLYNYSGNKLVELRDGDTLIATVDYEINEDEELTVTMESVLDDTSATCVYDEDRRKLDIAITDAEGDIIKRETYLYVKGDNGKVESVTVRREFYVYGSLLEVDRIEKFDEEEHLVEVLTRYKNEDSRSYVERWTGEYNDDEKLADSRAINCASVSFAFEDYTNEELFSHFDLFENGDFSSLAVADQIIYGNNDVLITDEIWSSTYDDNGNIDQTDKEKSTFKYASIANVLSWPDTTHIPDGADGEKVHDGDRSTYYGTSCSGVNVSKTLYSTHEFDQAYDIDYITFYANAFTTIEHTRYGGSCSAYVELQAYYDDAWHVIPGTRDGRSSSFGEYSGGAAGGTTDVSLMEVDLQDVTAIRAHLWGSTSASQGWGNTTGWLRVFEITAITPGSDYFNPVQLGHTVTNFDAEEYDSKNNVTKYTETVTDHNWSITSQGSVVDAGQFITITDWEGTYTVDRADTFTQVVNKTNPEGTLNLTETTTRTDAVYDSGKVVGYSETFLTTAAPDLTVERQVSEMTYQNGKVSGFTEISHEFGEDNEGNILDRTTTTVRDDMLYDEWARLIGWTDEITTQAAEDEVVQALKDIWQIDTDLQAWFPNVDEDDYDGVGAWSGKNIAHWAQEVGHAEYDELAMYAPDGADLLTIKTTSDIYYDDFDRMIAFTTVEEGLIGRGIGEPRVWEQKTTERIETNYNAINQVIYSKDTVTIELEDGSIKEDYPQTVEKTDIVYNESGQEYSYTSIVDGESSRIDSSTYNTLGQLTRQYTRIDGNSYSESYFYYDEAGNISQTKYHYYYHRSWSEKQGKNTVTYTQHNETTTWNDKYGEKTEEVKNEYFHIDVKKSFWSSFLGRAITTIISAVLNAIPFVGWAASLAFNTSLAIANDTFNMLSLFVQLGVNALQGFGGLLGETSPLESIFEGLGLDDLQIFGNVESTFTEQVSFDKFLFDASTNVIEGLVSEGIYELGRQNDWNMFLTSSLATFSSTALGYAWGGMTGKMQFENIEGLVAGTALKAVAIGVIDAQVSSNSAAWSQILGPVSKTLVGQLFKPTQPEKTDPEAQIQREEMTNGARLEVNNFISKVMELGFDLGYGQMYGSNNELGYIFPINRENQLPLGPFMQYFANEIAKFTLSANMILDENRSLEYVIIGDGDKYLTGEADYSELKLNGQAKNWADWAGLGFKDKIDFEMNLETGTLFAGIDVKNISSFLKQKGFQEREDISNLSQILDKSIDSINKIKDLRIMVKIRGNESELVNAVVIVDPSYIKDAELSGRVNEYLETNFKDLRNKHFDVVLDIDPKNNKVEVVGISLNLNKRSIQGLIKTLKENTIKQQKLGQQLENLVKLADGDPRNFEKVTLSVDNRGEYTINVKIRSEVLAALPHLMAKLRIGEDSKIHSRLSGRKFTNFTVDVSSGTYKLDLSLKCRRFENVIRSIGNIDKVVDPKGRLVSEGIYDNEGSLIKKIEYTYPKEKRFLFWTVEGEGGVTRKETFYARLANGDTKALHRTGEGKMVLNYFIADPDSVKFGDLSEFVGATFYYPIGKNIVQFSVLPIDGDIRIKGELPAAEMGLKFGLNTSTSIGDNESISYEAFSIGIRLEGESFIVDDNKFFNINGVDKFGAMLFTGGEEGSTRQLFLFNGSEIGVAGDHIIVSSGSALFLPVVNLSDGMANEAVTKDMEKGNILNKTMRAVDDLIWTPAIGDSYAPDFVQVNRNTCMLTEAGSLIPVEGIFEIYNSRAFSDRDTLVDIGEGEAINVSSKDLLTPEKIEQENFIRDTISEKLDPIYDAIIKGYELSSRSIFLSGLTKQLSNATGGIVDDISTFDGLMQTVLRISMTEGCMIAGVESAAAVAVLPVLLAKAVHTALSADERSLFKEVLGGTWRALVSECKDIWAAFRDSKNARNAVYGIRILGRKIGEYIAAAYVGTGAIKFAKLGWRKAKPFLSKIGGKLYGSFGRKITAKIRNMALKADQAFFSGGLSKSVNRIIQAYNRAGGYISGKLRLFNERVEQFIKERIVSKIKGIFQRGEGFEGAIFKAWGAVKIGVKGLSFVAEKAPEIAGKVTDTYLNREANFFISGLAKAEGYITRTAKRINTAWEMSRYRARFGQGRLVDRIKMIMEYEMKHPEVGRQLIDEFVNYYWLKTGGYYGFGPGVTKAMIAKMSLTYSTGAMLASVVDTAALNSAASGAVYDFIRPDFNDPTSIGANFWSGIYDDVKYAYDFWEDKVTAAKNWAVDTYNNITNNEDFREDTDLLGFNVNERKNTIHDQTSTKLDSIHKAFKEKHESDYQQYLKIAEQSSKTIKSLFNGKTLEDLYLEAKHSTHFKDKLERVSSWGQILGFKTEEELKWEKAQAIDLIIKKGQTGDILMVAGADPVGFGIRLFSVSKVNHAAILDVDEENNKWAIDINPGGIKRRTFEDWAGKDLEGYAVIKVGRVTSDKNAGRAAVNWIKVTYGYNPDTNRFKKSALYNYAGLFGINNNDNDTKICSELVHDAFKESGHPLSGVTTDNWRVSPGNIKGTMLEWGIDVQDIPADLIFIGAYEE